MSPLPELLSWAITLASLLIMAFILRDLSRRLGDALRIKKYYRLYDASAILLVISAAGIFLGAGLAARLLFLAGALLMVGTTAKYWIWIVPETLAGKKGKK